MKDPSRSKPATNSQGVCSWVPTSVQQSWDAWRLSFAVAAVFTIYYPQLEDSWGRFQALVFLSPKKSNLITSHLEQILIKHNFLNKTNLSKWTSGWIWNLCITMPIRDSLVQSFISVQASVGTGEFSPQEYKQQHCSEHHAGQNTWRQWSVPHLQDWLEEMSRCAQNVRLTREHP